MAGSSASPRRRSWSSWSPRRCRRAASRSPGAGAATTCGTWPGAVIAPWASTSRRRRSPRRRPGRRRTASRRSSSSVTSSPSAATTPTRSRACGSTRASARSTPRAAPSTSARWPRSSDPAAGSSRASIRSGGAAAAHPSRWSGARCGASSRGRSGSSAPGCHCTRRGGVLGKYRIVQVDGDSQSKAEVAINEAERLLNVEQVDILAGVYSSAHAVPLAEKVDKQKKFLWITTAISSKVFDGRNLQYTFRAQPTGLQFGELSVQYIADYAQQKLKKAPKDLRLAIIYEDGAYGTDVALGNELKAKDLGLNVVLKEGYSINAPDLSSLVTKLRSVRPDVLYHTGYNPDISLFLRQAKEQGLRLRAYIGHGAGHSQLDKLKEAFGKDVEFFHTLDPIASQLLDPKKLKPGVGELTAEMVKRYKAQYDKEVADRAIAPHVSMGFNNMWILLNDVVPRAITKYGGVRPQAPGQAGARTNHSRDVRTC